MTPDTRLAPVPYLPERLRRKARFGGAVVTEACHPAGVCIPSHYHATATLTFVMAGDFVEVDPAARTETPITGILFRPAGVTHRNRIGATGVRTLGIALESDRLLEWVGLAGLRAGSLHIADVRATVAAKRLHAELVHPDDLSCLAVEAAVADLLLGMARARNRQGHGTGTPRWMLQATEIVNERFRERGLTLSSLAREAGIEPATLARGFRRRFGVSVGEYLRRRRLEWALGLIRAGQLPIASAAVEAGFVDQSHLTRVCRDLLGETPAALRARAAAQGRGAGTAADVP